MQISVKGKQLDVGDSLRSHVQTALTELIGKYFPTTMDVQVTLTKDAHLYKAEITAHPAKGQIVQATGAANEPYPAFDEAARTMAKRLQRYRSKLQDRHGRASQDEAINSLNVKKVIFGAAANDASNDEAGDEPLVVAEMETPIQTLTVSEAVMALELEDLPALLFTNKGNNTLNMLYRRADGNIGWVDPTAVTTAQAGNTATGKTGTR